MNILIIGNGFDLAHKLPTQYTSFLNFIKFINKFETYSGTVSNFKESDSKFSELEDDVQKYICEVIEDNNDKFAKVINTWNKKKSQTDKSNKIAYIEEMIKLSKDNIWVKWFQEQINIHPNWIDFEAEISNVVQEVETMIPILPLGVDRIPKMSSRQRLINKHIFGGKATNKDINQIEIEEFKKKMLCDLNALIRCFEIYLEDCVRTIDKQLLSPDIYDLRIDYLLSFNYTDTYSRLYSCKNRNIEYDYIHGKSKIDSKSDNNMVLGIDDYLVGEERFSNTTFIEFKKYYQRLHKKTGCVYKKWIEQINKSKEGTIHNVYIFGHSLAMTDKDVLTEFIKNEKTRITIFYFSENQYSEQIINLVHMIGPDELNAMVYGATPKIIFKHQAEMINITNSEWEILNDRYLLWNIYNLNDKKASELIEKIKNKVNELNADYFYNQENIISLYSALINMCDTDYNMHDNLLRIAELLYDKDNHVEFDSFDWAEPDIRGGLYCDSRTRQLIYDINTLNNNISFKAVNGLCADDLNNLFKELSLTNIYEDKALELYDELLEQFKIEIDDCSMIWKCIYELQSKCPCLDWRNITEEKMENASELDKIRYRRIIDAIDEAKYIEEQMQAQEEYEEQEHS